MLSGVEYGSAAVLARFRSRDFLLTAANVGLVAALVLGMSALAFTTDFVGPHFSFEFTQAQLALSDHYEPRWHFKYVHLYGLRAFFELISSRSHAASAYSCVSSAALVVVIFALGMRSGGRWIGIASSLLAASFAPLAANWGTPIAQMPSTALAGCALLLSLCSARGWHPGMVSFASGVLCFLSLHCHVSGIAVWPVVLWMLASDEERRWKSMAAFAVGALVGQGGLMLADGLVAHDYLRSLRAAGLRQTFHHLSGAPWKTMARNHTFREPFFGALVRVGSREITILGLLGIVVSVRSSAVVRVLATWALLALPVIAWTVERSSTMASFALVCFTPALCVGTAHLLDRLWHYPGPERDAIPLWISILVGTLVCVLGISGIQAHINHQWLDRTGYAALRGDMFFFRLTVPLCLAAAALLRQRWLRIIPFSLAVVALLLAGRGRAEDELQTYREHMKAWHQMANAVWQRHEPKIAVYYTRARPQRFRPAMIERRLNLLADHETPSVQVRIVSDLKAVKSEEFLFLEHGSLTELMGLSFAFPPPFHRFLVNVKHGKSTARVFLPADAMIRSHKRLGTP